MDSGRAIAAAAAAIFECGTKTSDVETCKQKIFGDLFLVT